MIHMILKVTQLICFDMLEEQTRNIVLSQYNQWKLWLTQGIIINVEHIHH
jgi:hypothetical protein